MNFGLETELAHSYDHMVQKGQTTQTDNSTNYTGNNRTSTHGNNYSMLYDPKYSVVV